MELCGCVCDVVGGQLRRSSLFFFPPGCWDGDLEGILKTEYHLSKRTTMSWKYISLMSDDNLTGCGQARLLRYSSEPGESRASRRISRGRKPA